MKAWGRFLVWAGFRLPPKAPPSAAAREVTKWYGGKGGDEIVKTAARRQGIKGSASVGPVIASVGIAIVIGLVMPLPSLGVGILGFIGRTAVQTAVSTAVETGAGAVG